MKRGGRFFIGFAAAAITFGTLSATLGYRWHRWGNRGWGCNNWQNQCWGGNNCSYGGNQCGWNGCGQEQQHCGGNSCNYQDHCGHGNMNAHDHHEAEENPKADSANSGQ